MLQSVLKVVNLEDLDVFNEQGRERSIKEGMIGRFVTAITGKQVQRGLSLCIAMIAHNQIAITKDSSIILIISNKTCIRYRISYIWTLISSY